MTIHSFIDRLTQLISWLYYQHQWAEWEMLAIAVAALVPLLLIARQQRKEKLGRGYAHQLRERSPIIGVKLANGKDNRQDIADLKRGRLAFFHRKKDEERTTSSQLDRSSEQIKQLQDEITKRRQIEARLEQQLTELTAANERLQHETAESRQTEERLKQQTAELLATNEKLQHGLAKHKPVEDFLKKQIDRAPAASSPRTHDLTTDTQTEHIEGQAADVPAAQQLPRDSLSRRGHEKGVLTENPKQPAHSRHTSEPLDVEKLKAIAALARKIQERPRRE
jgi:septal ring factor EnvC (AmiA/AmiB activator)